MSSYSILHLLWTLFIKKYNGRDSFWRLVKQKKKLKKQKNIYSNDLPVSLHSIHEVGSSIQKKVNK